MKNSFYLLFLFLFTISFTGFAQNSSTGSLPFDVSKNYPSISVSKAQLTTAQSLTDLHEKYKSEWVRAYIAVEVMTIQNGRTKKAAHKNSEFSKEQKNNMLSADAGTDISVKVQYIPENTLKQNEAKEMSFTISVEPETDAEYAGGKQQLIKYLKETAIDKIPDGIYGQYQLSAVLFTIDEEGRVVNPQIFWPSNNEKVDKLLLDAVCNMPNWQPATYANGTKVKQEFAFTVGDMESCVTPLLNIRRN